MTDELITVLNNNIRTYDIKKHGLMDNLKEDKPISDYLKEFDKQVLLNSTYKERSLLAAALVNRNTEMLKYMIEIGADVNEKIHFKSRFDKDALLFVAIESHNHEALELLLKSGADIKCLGEYPLLICMPYGRHYSQSHLREENNDEVKSLEILLKCGITPNPILESDEYKYTPVIYAAERNFRKSVKLLIDYGAIVNNRTFEYLTNMRYKEMVKYIYDLVFPDVEATCLTFEFKEKQSNVWNKGECFIKDNKLIGKMPRGDQYEYRFTVK